MQPRQISVDQQPHVLVRAYGWLIFCAGYLQSAVLLLLRLAVGYSLLQSGFGHLTHIHKTAEFFQTLHIPMPLANAYIAGGTELVGGALFMLGLATRLIALPVIFNFCIAYITDARPSIHALLRGNPDDFIGYTAFPFLLTSVLMLAFGAGKFSIDFLLQKLVFELPDPSLGDGFPVSMPGTQRI